MRNRIVSIKNKDIKDEVVDETANETSKKEKKHSNKKTVLMILGIVVIACLAIILIRGGWNPFKSKTVEKEAIKQYEESATVANDLWTTLNPEDAELDENSSYYRELQAEFGPNGKFPYGFQILEDNGKEGKKGVLKSMITASSEYDSAYGFDYTVYYMINDDYANEKYNQLKHGDTGVNDFRKEYSFSNGKITIARSGELDLVLFYIKVGTVVYQMDGRCSTYTVDKVQALFNKLNIQYTPIEVKDMQ